MSVHPFLQVSRYCTRRQLWWLLVWPVAALLMCASGAWWLAKNEVDARTEVDAVARHEASALASAYAQQLSYTVDQIDRNLLSLKYFLENAPRAVRLQEMARKGMYPLDKNVYINVFDADGRLRDSTAAVPYSADIARDELFEQLGAHPNAGLSITKHESAPGVARPTVWFSRRLEKPDGEFSGVISAAVESRILGSFYDRTAIGRGDFVTVRTTTGKILSTKMGEQIRSYTGIFRKPPAFKVARGVELYPATSFNDNEARLYAWDTLERYPLISTVGLLESDIQSGLLKTTRTKRRIGLATGALVCLIALSGMFTTMTWLRRRHLANISRTRYLLAIESGNEGFFSLYPLLDAAGNTIDFVISECNERGAAMLGQEKTLMTGQRISQFCTPEKFPSLLARFMQAMSQGSFEDQFRQPNADGATRVFNRYLIRSASGIALTLRDISESKAHEAQLHALANRDALTNVYNRHWFMAYLPPTLTRAAIEQKQLALLFVDLDNFKEINNTYGHNAGDALLVSTCERFSHLLRAQDHVVRLGGDEFTIILEGVGRSEIVDIADRLIDALSEPFVIDNISVDIVRASIGIAVFPEDGTVVDTLVRHADEAMYAVKRAGKSNYRFYDSLTEA